MKVFIIFLDLANSILSCLWQAWVFTIIWSWLLIPWFHFPAITIGEAIIILIYANLANYEAEKGEYRVKNAYLYPLYGLIASAIIRLIIFHSL